VILLESHKNEASSPLIHKNSTRGDVDSKDKNNVFSNAQNLRNEHARTPVIQVYEIFCKEFCLIIVLPLRSKSETLDPGKGYDELHMA
jgi:hypothetical protein